MRPRTVDVAAKQIHVVVPVATYEAVRVRGDKTGMLQKTRIHLAPGAWVLLRYRVDQVVLKPCKWVARRQAVDRGGASSRVDRAAHQNQAFRGSPFKVLIKMSRPWRV
jgi:hypothetical protein